MEHDVIGEGPHPVDRHVGRRVCQRRIELGYNQSDLARALGLTFQQIQKYEKGANRISASKLWDTARFLKVDVDWFFEGLADHAAASPSDAGPATPRSSDPEYPVTRASVEIDRLAPRLSTPRQRLMLDVIKTFALADPAIRKSQA